MNKHLFYYVSLLVVLLLSAVVIFLTPDEQRLHMGVIIFAACFYVFWAILHHLIHHDLHTKVVVEYVLIAMVGISLVYFVLTSVT